MKVTALVLNYRSPRVACACVQALLQQTVPAEDLRILLIDNHSDNESIQWLRNTFHSEPRVRIVEHSHNLGYGQGNDAALRFADGDAILIINPDNILEPNGLRTMLALLESDSGIGIIAPKLVHEDGTVRDSSRAFPHVLDVIAKRTALGRILPSLVERYVRMPVDMTQAQDVDWVVGACLLMRRDWYETLGGFDPRFFLFFEDMDLCRRCWEAGKRVVYLPTVTAADRKRRLSEGGIWQLLTSKVGRIHIQSALRYFRKWWGVAIPAIRRG